MYDAEATFRVNINAFTNANIYRPFPFYIELMLNNVLKRRERIIFPDI